MMMFSSIINKNKKRFSDFRINKMSDEARDTIFKQFFFLHGKKKDDASG